MSAVYLIEGKPHRECDCDQSSEVCWRHNAKRALMTCGFARCLVPAPDVVMSPLPEPTERMWDAAVDAITALYRGDGGWCGREAALEQARRTWNAMKEAHAAQR